MKRAILAGILAVLLTLSLTGCGGGNADSGNTTREQDTQSNQPVSPPDLTGEWKQSNSNAEDSYQAAYITDDVMEIYWILNEGSEEEMFALYWAGSFTPLVSADEPYTWESRNDTGRTNSALLASGDETKSFTYQNGQISYDVTFQGETMSVTLEKREWGYGTKGNGDFLADTLFNGGSSSESGETLVGSGDIGDYHVEIKDAALANDYNGNPAIVITYAWTNNSEDTTNAMITILEKAFQDGVQLDTAMIFDSTIYDSGYKSKDVRPGTTIDVQCAFELTSETSVVEFELSEAFSWTDGNIVTMNFDPAELAFG